MATGLYPTFEKRVSDATNRLVTEQVVPWLFMRERLSVKRFDGTQISYEGIDFDGSPRLVFWSGFIEPFLEGLVIGELSVSVAAAKEKEVDAKELIPELQGLLRSACRKIFDEMAEVDQRLRGNGFPENVPRRNVDPECARMMEFIDRHALAELQMWKPRRAYERWYDQNKFWVWAAGIVVAIASIAAKFM